MTRPRRGVYYKALADELYKLVRDFETEELSINAEEIKE